MSRTNENTDPPITSLSKSGRQLSIQQIQEWQTLIAEDQLGKLLKELSEWGQDSEYTDVITVLMAEYNNLNRDMIRQVISEESRSLKVSKLRDRLLSLLDALKRSRFTGQEFLHIKLAENDREFLLILQSRLPSKYTDLKLIYKGDYANVYKATRDKGTQWEEIVAIKAFKTLSLVEKENWMELEKRLANATSLSRMDGTVGLLDMDMDLPPRYIVMEFFDGMTLAEQLKLKWPMELWEIKQVIHQITGTLFQGHIEGLIHNNIKPSNIFMERRLGPRLSPFQMMKSAFTQLNPGRIRNRYSYLSPEELNGRTPTVWSDQFSLGVLFFEIFKQEPLFGIGRQSTDNQLEVIDILKKRIEYHTSTRKAARAFLAAELEGTDCPSKFVSVIERMTRSKPDDRYPNLGYVLDEIERIRAIRPRREEEDALRCLEDSYEHCRREPDFFFGFYKRLIESNEKAKHEFGPLIDKLNQKDTTQAWEIPEEKFWDQQHKLVDHAFIRLLRHARKPETLGSRLNRLLERHMHMNLTPTDFDDFLHCLKETIRDHDVSAWKNRSEKLDEIWEEVTADFRKLIAGKAAALTRKRNEGQKNGAETPDG